jgi:hypothetical protein
MALPRLVDFGALRAAEPAPALPFPPTIEAIDDFVSDKTL